MNAFTTLGAVLLGLVAFGESLGRTTWSPSCTPLALGLVLVAVRPLIRGQQALAPSEAGGDRDGLASTPRPAARARVRTAVAWAGGLIAGLLALVASLLIGTGLLYVLRGQDLLGAGPRIHDALPLLQLAGFDGQPLGRVAVAWLAAGFAAGAIGLRVAPARRLVLALLIATPLALLASDASFALARNLPLISVLHDRTPPLGPWLEAMLLAVGAALPGLLVWRSRDRGSERDLYVGPADGQHPAARAAAGPGHHELDDQCPGLRGADAG